MRYVNLLQEHWTLLTLPNPGIITTASGQLLPLVQCVAFCNTNQLGLINCIIPSLSEQGPCYECGPFKTNPAEELCEDECVDTSSDPDNCGRCGNSVSLHYNPFLSRVMSKSRFYIFKSLY